MAATASYQGNATDGTDTTTYSFASQPFGTAASDRIVVVGILGRAPTTGAVSSVTIGGVSATLITQNAAAPTPPFATIGALYAALVPTGTTGTIDVVFSVSQVRCAIGIWSIYGATGVSPVSSGNDITGNPEEVVLVVPNNSCVIGMAASNGSVTPNIVWTGITEDFDINVEAGSSNASGAHDNFTAGNTALSVQAQFNAAGSSDNVLCVAAWGPPITIPFQQFSEPNFQTIQVTH